MEARDLIHGVHAWLVMAPVHDSPHATLAPSLGARIASFVLE